MRIWNRALTPAEIRSTVFLPGSVPAGQVAYWQFNEGTGTTAFDSSGNNNHGTLTNGPQWVARNTIDLLARGPDDSLWHCVYTVDGNGCVWEREAGGVLLSAPAVISIGPGQFEVYAILVDNRVHRRTWDSNGWSAAWEDVDVDGYWPAVSLYPMPELDPPGVVYRGGQVDLFRKGPDNTLLHRYYNGSTWDASWSTLGGFLASGPAAISSGLNNIQVFAHSAEGILWTRTYNGNWGSWQPLAPGGMPEGVTIASAPAVLVPAANQIDLYVRGSDGHLYQAHFAGGLWGNWVDGGGKLASAVSVAQVSGEPYLFAQTNSGGLQANRPGMGWENLAGGLAPCCTVVDTGLHADPLNSSFYNNFTLNIETGYLKGDGRAQIVLGYYSGVSEITIAVYDISDSDDQKGFTPELLASTTLDGSQFSFATGDFLDDDYGLDDIAIAYINGWGEGYAVLKLDYDPVSHWTLTPELSDDFPGIYDIYFDGSLNIVSGDFDADGKDEFAINDTWTNLDEDGPGSCRMNWFFFHTYIYDVFYTPQSGFTIKGFLVDGNTYYVANKDADTNSVAITLAAGDVDGDSRDEIIRTWPTGFGESWQTCDDGGGWVDDSDLFQRQTQVIDLPENADRHTAWQTDPDPQIKNKAITTIFSSGQNGNSYGDRLAVGDFDRDLVQEILIQEGTWGAPGYTSYQVLHSYKYNPITVAYEQKAERTDTWRWLPHLVVGDFTGEGLRVGPPSYRVQSKMVSPIAFLNLPPMHRDIIGSTEYTAGIGAYCQTYHHQLYPNNLLKRSRNAIGRFLPALKPGWGLPEAKSTPALRPPTAEISPNRPPRSDPRNSLLPRLPVFPTRSFITARIMASGNTRSTASSMMILWRIPKRTRFRWFFPW